jgi:ribosomal protein L29
MKIADLRSKTKKELRSLLRATKGDIEKTALAMLKGKEKNVKKKMRLKKNYARVLTVLNEKIVLEELEQQL